MKQGDTTFQGQAVVLPTLYMGTFNNDLSVVTDTVITGVGFKPSSVEFCYAMTTPVRSVWGKGYSDETDNYYIKNNRAGTLTDYSINSGFAFSVTESGGTDTKDGLVTFQSDGFTISWTQSGAMVGNVGVAFIAKK